MTARSTLVLARAAKQFSVSVLLFLLLSCLMAHSMSLPVPSLLKLRLGEWSG